MINPEASQNMKHPGHIITNKTNWNDGGKKAVEHLNKGVTNKVRDEDIEELAKDLHMLNRKNTPHWRGARNGWPLTMPETKRKWRLISKDLLDSGLIFKKDAVEYVKLCERCHGADVTGYCPDCQGKGIV